MRFVASPLPSFARELCDVQPSDARPRAHGLRDDTTVARAPPPQYYMMGTQAGNGNLIPILSSKSLTGPWARSGAVFSSLPAWARRAVPGASGIWAPDVSWSATTQRWRVYYAVSTFGSQVRTRRAGRHIVARHHSG